MAGRYLHIGEKKGNAGTVVAGRYLHFGEKTVNAGTSGAEKDTERERHGGEWNCVEWHGEVSTRRGLPGARRGLSRGVSTGRVECDIIKRSLR